MHLISSKFHVTVRNEYGMDAALKLSAVLRCQACAHDHVVCTSGHLLPQTPNDLPRHVGWEVEDMKLRRDCENCGATSALPKKDQQQLLTAAGDITMDWISSALEQAKLDWRRTREQMDIALEPY